MVHSSPDYTSSEIKKSEERHLLFGIGKCLASLRIKEAKL